MERTLTIGGDLNPTNLNPTGNVASPANTNVEASAQAAHKTIDRIAEKASAQVDRSAEVAHHAVDGAADATMSAAEWASTIATQARQVHVQLTESASASIRARPIVMVAGAVVVGFLLGRLARP